MTFLTPLFLLGALAVVGPVVFHLVRRATRDRVPFSSLDFLRPTPPRLDRRSRVEHWLLLLLRCTAILLLALGFARPFLKGIPDPLTTATRSKRVVLLLDTSASLQRPGAWDHAKERVRHHLQNSSGIQDLALVAFDRTPRVLLSFNEWRSAASQDRVPLVESRLTGLEPGWSETRIDTALLRGLDLLGETLPGPLPEIREIVVLSDLQEGSHTEGLQAADWPKGVKVLLDPIRTSQPGNAGLEILTGSDVPAEATSSGIRVRVVNSPDATADRFEIGWSSGAAGGRIGAPLALQVPPGQSRVVTVPRPETTAADRLVLTGDPAAFDNTVFVAPRPTNALLLRYIGAATDRTPRSPLYFLERALPERGTPPVSWIQQTADAQAVGQFIVPSKLTVVAAPPSPPVQDLVRIDLQAGGTVLVLANTPEAVQRLGALLGTPDLTSTPETSPGGALLVNIDFRHPLFTPFADPRFNDFSRIRVWKHQRLDPNKIPGAKVLARFDSGDPAVLEVPVGPGRVVILPWGWRPEDSQWVLSTKFVPFLMALLDHSGAMPSDRDRLLTVGDPLPLPSTSNGSARELELPTGERVPIPATKTTFTETVRPGFYRLQGDGTDRTWAVQVAPAESRTAPTLGEVLDAVRVPLTDRARTTEPEPATPAAQAAAETEGRQKLWRWFLAATLLILGIETIAAGWAARRSTRLMEGPA